MQANGGVAQEAARVQKERKLKEREYRKLEAELRRKEAALAETAALLVLRKKADAIFGGRRGRLISTSDRKMIIELIEEATKAGARENRACLEIGISQRTLQRWRSAASLQDQRPVAKRPKPKNKLSGEEVQEIISIANSRDFRVSHQPNSSSISGLR